MASCRLQSAAEPRDLGGGPGGRHSPRAGRGYEVAARRLCNVVRPTYLELSKMTVLCSLILRPLHASHFLAPGKSALHRLPVNPGWRQDCHDESVMLSFKGTRRGLIEQSGSAAEGKSVGAGQTGWCFTRILRTSCLMHQSACSTWHSWTARLLLWGLEKLQDVA